MLLGLEGKKNRLIEDAAAVNWKQKGGCWKKN